MSVRSARRFVCGRRTLVPGGLFRTVMDVAHASGEFVYTEEDIFSTLVCTIQMHKKPVHYGVVLNLRGPEAGTLWALWRDGGVPHVVIEIPDCLAGRDVDCACSEFEGHPGGHSWELDDLP